ncbi:hypothetical protein [Methylomicrobium lacus]|uniref:hypothetical protein n=1 Tax=Methylomicrobium lacus TaxID=136992 RepID=UPI0035A8EF46
MKTAIVKLSLLSTAQGGRSLPIVHLRDFSCPVFFKNIPELAEHGYDCRILVKQYGREIHPGDIVQEIQIAFLSPDDVFSHIKKGVKFDLWESRKIGEGEVVAIV